MFGRYDVIIQNAYISYEFTICRNITVIRGDSATGKTTLVDMIRSYNEEDDTGITVRCDVPVEAVYGRDWRRQLDSISNSIIFIDEQSRFIKSKEFAEVIKGSDNYYVIVTREKLSELPYSITEIYGIRLNGKYANLQNEYARNEFYRVYGEKPHLPFTPNVIITEDSGSGYEFWCAARSDAKTVAAEGKSNIIKLLKELKDKNVKFLAVVDGAAYGAEMEEMMQYIEHQNQEVELYAPESFEYLVLSSGLFDSSEIRDKCVNTEKYADSVRYMSWEQFYTDVLVKATANTLGQYGKSRLNMYYLSERNMQLILREVPDVLIQ